MRCLDRWWSDEGLHVWQMDQEEPEFVGEPAGAFRVWDGELGQWDSWHGSEGAARVRVVQLEALYASL